MHWMSILGLILITIGGILSFFGTQFSDKKNQDDLSQKIQEKNTTIDSINSNNVKLIQQNSDLLNSNNDVSNSNKELINQNREMLGKVSQYQIEIEEKNSTIKELEEKASQAERGIESKTQFDGSHRVRQGGMNSLNSSTEENSLFIKMQNFNNLKNFAELILICDESIKKFPNWYTAYYFKATSLLNINDKTNKVKALELIDFIAKHTIGDVDYAAPLSILLIQMKEIQKAKEIINRVPIDALNMIENKEVRDVLLNLKK